jgi:hypothetical protein
MIARPRFTRAYHTPPPSDMCAISTRALHEQPKALAALITEFERGLSKTPELQSKTRAASARQ